MTELSWLETVDRWGFEGLRVLAGLTWQTTLLFATLFACSFLVKGWPTWLRRGMWLAGFLTIPFLPLLGQVAEWIDPPRAEISLLPRYTPSQASFWKQAGEYYNPSAKEDRISALGTASSAAYGQDVERAGLASLSPWSYAFLLYLGVVALLLLRLAAGQLRILRWIRSSNPVSKKRSVAFHFAAKKLGLSSPFQVRETDSIDSLCTVGYFRRTVLLPKGFSSSMSPSELQAVALHEVSHILRRDTMVLAFAALTKAVFFFHPLIWMAAKQLQELIEETADDTVLRTTQDPVSYAKMLTRLAEEMGSSRVALPQSAAGFLISKSSFLKRIEFIVSDRHRSIFHITYRTVCAIALTLLTVSELVIAFPLAEASYLPRGFASGAANLHQSPLLTLFRQTYSVGQNQPYPNLQAALSDPGFRGGDVIEIEDRVLSGDVVIDKPVRIAGKDGREVEIRGGLNVTSPGVILEGLRVSNPAGNGILLVTDGAGLQLVDCEISDNQGKGIAIDGNGVTLVVFDSRLCRNGGTGIEVDSNQAREGTHVRLERCILAENGQGHDLHTHMRRAIDWRDTKHGSLSCQDCVFVGTADGLGDRVVTSNSHNVDGMKFYFKNCVIARPPSFDRDQLDGADDSKGLHLEYKSSGGIDIQIEGITISGFNENKIRTKNGSQSTVRIQDVAIRDIQDNPLFIRENMGDFSISDLLIEGGESEELLKIEGCKNATFNIENVVLRDGKVGLSVVNNGQVEISVLGMVAENNREAIRVAKGAEDWTLPTDHRANPTESDTPTIEAAKTSADSEGGRIKVARYLLQENGDIDLEIEKTIAP
jgi:beta-lactamase regulating signal transducer with metallopeptidase domain